MTQPNVLVFCKHPDILATILRLIHKKEDWKATGVSSVEAAQAECNAAHTGINLVLLGAGVDETEEDQLRKSLSRPGITFIRHYGGGSGLLYAEVLQALVP